MAEQHSGSRRQESGFTLIELLVVIIILGIISAVVVFAVRGTGDKGAAAAFATDAKTIRTAQEVFCSQNGRYATEQELLDRKLLSSLSDNHEVRLSSGGPCKAAAAAGEAGADGKTAFSITCQVAKTGCGAAGATVLGRTLVVGETFASNATTNVASTTGGGTHAWWEIMYNGLIELDEAGNPAPELATEVPTVANGGISDSGATYTLKLRPGVKWHDGTGFTGDDVKFTFEKVLLKHHARARNMAAPLGYNATSCRANNIVVSGADRLTVTFEFLSPYAPFLKQLNVTEAAMNPARDFPALPAVGATPAAPAVSATGTACPTQAQADAIKIGTGPFKFDSINSPQAGDGKVVKNNDYWRGADKIDLGAILMRPKTTESSRLSALLSGEVDWVWDLPNPDVAAVSANPNFRTASTQSLGGGPNSIDTVIFNLKASGSTVASVADGTATDHPILGDVRVRKAIFQALNRNEFLTTGRSGIGKVALAPISSEIFGHAADIGLPAFDVAAANNLLDAAGWGGARQTVNGTPNVRTRTSDGTTPLTIRFLYGNVSFDSRIAVVKSNLAAVGIDLQAGLNSTDANTQVFTNRNFDMYIINYAHGYDPHVGVRRQYHRDQISTSGTPNNAAGYRNGTVDTAFDSAVMTLDPATRLGHYRTFQQQVVTDLPYVWMIETPNVRGYTAKCTGFKAYTGLFAETASCQK